MSGMVCLKVRGYGLAKMVGQSSWVRFPRIPEDRLQLRTSPLPSMTMFGVDDPVLQKPKLIQS
jgi:hypothetical protein